MAKEFKFEIVEHLLTIRKNDSDWTLELNRVSFNGRPAKYDIREWSPDHKSMGKGVTLCDEEAEIMAAKIVDKFFEAHPELIPNEKEKIETTAVSAPRVEISKQTNREADIVPFRNRKTNDPQPLNKLKTPEKSKMTTKPKSKQKTKIETTKSNWYDGVTLQF